MRAVWLQDYADENRNGGVLARGASAPLAASPSISDAEAAVGTLDNDDLLGALEAKAAALVKVGGKVKGLDLEFDSLALSLANGKKLLNGVTGKLPSGRLCAIMGPSGAGKTTFLYTLCGKATYGTMSGDLRINGEQCGVDAYRASFGFVPQEDVMLRTMTVSEICHFYAQMRLPPEFSQLQRSQVAETVIDVLGMSHVQDSKIGDEETRGISGGQRKRVNIAMEMVGKPSILLLDEPTSGLDATSSLQLVKALRATAKQGICVAAVLHQPRYEMFCLFHDVLLLGKGGFTVYLGPAYKAKDYFESLGYSFPPQCNPADHIMDIIGGEVPHEGQDPQLDCVALQESGINLAKKWEDDTVFNTHHAGGSSSSTYDSNVGGADGNGTDAKDRKKAAFVHQLLTYTKRAFVQQYRPFNTVLLDYSLIFIAGALLGLAQRNTELTQLPISGALSGLGIGLTTIISSTRCFGDERIVFWREAASGLSRPAYFIGKNIAEIPRLVFIPGFYLVIFTAVTGNTDHHAGEYWVLLFAVWAVSGLGYLVSVLVKPLNSQLAGVLVVLVSLMANGIFVPKKRMGRMNSWGVPQLSYAYHMAKSLYLLNEESFTDFQIPNVDGVKFDIATNACPLDQACMGWVSIKDSIRYTYDLGPACPGPLCEEGGVSGPPGGHIPSSAMWGMFFIGIFARVACFVALVATNRHKQI
jgi:ABC-type multidrug transport system ATPase subunit